MPITLEQARGLKYRDTLHHVTFKNADGTPMRFRVNGVVKTWKRDLERIRVPLKRGLWEHGYLTNGSFEGGGFTLDLGEVGLGEGMD